MVTITINSAVRLVAKIPEQTISEERVFVRDLDALKSNLK
jgi:hypothetical protein